MTGVVPNSDIQPKSLLVLVVLETVVPTWLQVGCFQPSSDARRKFPSILLWTKTFTGCVLNWSKDAGLMAGYCVGSREIRGLCFLCPGEGLRGRREKVMLGVRMWHCKTWPHGQRSSWRTARFYKNTL